MDNEIKIGGQHKNTKVVPTKQNQKSLIYLLIFLFTLHFTPATYVESTFIEGLVGGKNTGFIYSIASFATIIGIIFARKIIRKSGNFKTFISVLFIEFISLLILSLSLFAEKNSLSTTIFIIAFISGFLARSIAFLNFDIFIETLSKNENTGNIRGGFLTSLNFAFVIGPIMAGLLLNNNTEIPKVFFLGNLILIPVIYIALAYFKNFKETDYKHYHFIETIKYVLTQGDLWRIFACNFLLFFFYSWMIIYTPIFLLNNIGFSLTEIGLITGIALLPFLMLQYFLGNLADKKYGEKEILTIGFIITGLSTIMMSIIGVKVFALWAIILFITRIGASMIESMVETYLFKKVNAGSVDIIGVFRSTRPVAYILAPVIASMLLLVFSIEILFFALGLVMLTGILFSLKITDTL